MSGKKDPDLSVVRMGASRGEVELQLGKPKQTASIDAGRRVDSYEYEVGNEPSAGRAVAHGVMDVLTLGLWEVVGTPVEALQGDKHVITVTYDRNDRVEAVNVSAPPSPPQPPAKTERDSGSSG